MEANLVLLSKKGKQKTVPLASNVTIIGRRRNCDLRIPLESVSKRHCQIIYNKPETIKLKDLGSKNGTFVNGKKINEETVKAGDFIKIGPIMFALQVNGEPQEICLPAQTKKTKSPQSTPSSSEKPLEDSFIDLDDTDKLGDLNDSNATLDDLDDL